MMKTEGVGNEQWQSGGDYSGRELSGNARGACLDNASFRDGHFVDFDLRGASLKNVDLFELTIVRADLRGADLSGARNMDKAIALGNARFSDDTIVDDIDLDRVAIRFPLVAQRLKQSRYAGALKRRHATLYWLWQVSCGCGRSWSRLLTCGALLTLVFACAYWLGTTHPQSAWLPNPAFDPECGDTWNEAVRSVQFSAMTFVGFNAPGATWADAKTGTWVALECWIGLAFLGIFISVVATQMAAKV
ncbi:MAG: pentapeptide repeat-containing protein [Phycisphaerae bacterium]|nr:pentapeptide repeat-containing protein [Phycisphaerae bacterium]